MTSHRQRSHNELPAFIEFSPERRRTMYVEYMRMKIHECDWHGVADCAMDLRELEATYPHLRSKS